MSYKEETGQLISGDDKLYYRQYYHCACVWILSDVDFTDAGNS